MSLEKELYTYRAKVVSVYDGDTIRVDLDLGFGIKLENQSIRLYGINAPEVRGESREEGIVTRDRLRGIILDKYIIIKTHKDSKGKYGRWIGTVFADDSNINELLVEEGLVESRSY
jgi:micrococcal nuclease